MMLTPQENSERLDKLETRIKNLEDLLREIAGMAKLLRWTFALLALLGVLPFAAEKMKLFLAAASR